MLAGVRCKWLLPGEELDIPTEDCRGCASTGRNPCGYPYPFIHIMTRDRDPKVVSCSATMFEGCPREHGLKKDFDYYVRPEEAHTRAFGSMVHFAAETIHAADEHSGAAVVEGRYARTLSLRDGRVMRVTAAMDMLHIDERDMSAIIKDYKVVDSVSDSAISRRLDRYVPQFSIQKWILASHGITVQEIELAFFAHKAKRNVNLFPHGEPEFPNAYVMNEAQTERYLLERGPVLLDSLSGHYPPPLTDRSVTWMCRRCDVRDICCDLYGGTIPGLR